MAVSSRDQRVVMKRIILYLKLMRFDRPIGIFLLLSPTLWGLWLAGAGRPNPKIVAIFIAGVVVMRALGCVVNDIADRDIDPLVERTRLRPLASGAVRPYEAWLLVILLSVMALLLVSLLNRLTIGLAVIGFLVMLIYPLMKRISNGPQFVLAIVFGAWPILMAYTALQNRLPATAYYLALAAFFWTVSYDTFYAMADQAEDQKIGVKSTAFLFGRFVRLWIAVLQIMMLVLLLIVGSLARLNVVYHISLLLVAILFAYEHYRVRAEKPQACFTAFLHNKWVGLVIFIGIFGAYL